MIWGSHSGGYEEGWKWRRHIPPKYQLTFIPLHGVISQKIELLNFSSIGLNTIRMLESSCVGEFYVAELIIGLLS
jgi:hypothetical protein